MLKKGSIITIKDNLQEELIKLKYKTQLINNLIKFIGCNKKVLDIWEDKNGQQYVTIGSELEIPLQCCEELIK